MRLIASTPRITEAPPLTRPINAVIVIDHLGFANGVVHGPARMLQEILPRLDPDRVRVTLCVVRERHPLASEFEAAGFTPIFLGRGKWDPMALTDLVRLLRARDADVVHLLGEKAMILGRIAAKIAGCSAIIHFQDTKRSSPAIRFVARRLAPWTAAAVGCADQVVDMAVADWNIPRDRARTLFNGHNIERFARPAPRARERIRAELGLGPSAPVIAVVGRMAPEKGHDILINAMPTILTGLPAAILLIVGNGATRRPCEALARSLGIERSVRFIGQRDDIPEVLAASDVVALPSRFGEGLPGAAVEAIAAGRAVVAFPVAGTVDVVVHERTGLVVPQDDGQAMARALLRLLTDADLRAECERAGREHSMMFHINEHVRQTQELYAHAAAAR